MSDLYQGLAQSFVGQLFVKNLGLPDPPSLRRWSEGAPLVDGTVLLGGAGGRLVQPLTSQLTALDVDIATAATDGARYLGLVFDATGITDVPGLTALQEFFTPVMRSLAANSRLVVLGTPPEATGSDPERIAQRSLEGFTRSLGKEVGRGGTVQLVYVAEGAERSLSSTLAFLLSPKSAYVSAQVIRVGTLASGMVPPVFDVGRPLTGKVALVTGAARGIGASIAEVLHRDGATIVGVDVPPATNDLNQVMTRLGGTAVTLDITSEDAPARIAGRLEERHDGVDIVVHNAGITRDKKLANMSGDRFSSTLEVNLHAPQLITEELLERKLIRPGGAIIGVSSISGIAGNLGQTNYATSKAGVIGFVDALSARVADQSITVNAVAPGFIETQMTAKMPLVLREAGRRMNSMSQGGLPVDVAETISWFASPGSVAVSGNVVRVDGQSLLGA
jgi:3-oxoacyl-[acyl-carrier protein] reductase